MIKFGILIFVVALVSLVRADDDGDVLVLTKDNFDSTVNNADIILVEFYAPWCGHCKHLAPEYAKAATILKNNDPPVALGKVDATVESDLGNRFEVRGYPTLKIFRKGVPSEYGGPREANGIVSYMQKQVGPSAKPMSTEEDLKKFIANNKDISVVGFFPSKSSSSYTNFLKVADTLRDNFRFAVTNEKKVAEGFGYSDVVVIFKEFDEKTAIYGGETTTQALVDWIYEKSVPTAGELTKDNENRYKKKGLPILKAYFEVDYAGGNLKRTNYYLNRLKKVAEDPELKSKISFAVVNKKSFSDEIAKFNFDGKAEAFFGIDDFTNTLKYKMDGEFSVESLKKFAKDFVDGKLKPYIKSEPVPEQKEGSPVVVVGQTFNDIVLDPTKDVLIELYAPWCGHCKKLEPVYNQLAEKMKKVDGVVIAKMDATANDSPHGSYQAKGYPTILFAPAKDKSNPIPFQGEREVGPMYDWIKSRSTTWKKKEEL